MDMKQKNIVRFLCISAVTLTFILLSVLIYQFARIGRLSSEKSKLNNAIVEISEQIDDYQRQVDNMEDMNFLEDYARESGWAQRGDIKFY